MSFRTSLVSLLMGLLPFSASLATAAESSDVIRFQRVLVPEDRIKDWPKDEGRYLPVDAVEFDRLLTAAPSSRASDGAVPPAVVIAAAQYEAKLSGDQLVGHARAQVVLSGPAPRCWISSPAILHC